MKNYGSSKLADLLRISTLSLIVFTLLVTFFESNIVYWSIGTYSLSAYLTLATPAAMLLFVGLTLAHRIRISVRRNESLNTEVLPKALARPLLPWILLVLYGTVSLAIWPRLEGLQNVLALSAFSLGVLTFSVSDRHSTSRAVNEFLPMIGAVSGALFILSQIIDTETRYGIEFFSPRQFAMVAVVTLAAALNSSVPRWPYRVAPYLILVSISFSASRTATAAAILLFLLRLWSSSENAVRFFRKLAGLVSLLLATFLVGILTTRDLAERFSTGGAEQTTVLSDSGRFSAWERFLGLPDSWLDWFLGLGSGASAEFGQRELVFFPQTLNEYLRFLIDNGIVGLFLFMWGLIALILLCNPLSKEVSARNAAGLATVGLAMIATTDGPFYSIFVVLPAALVVGAGIADAIERKRNKPL